MKKIKLTQGKVALVDDEDYDFINQWKWNVVNERGRFYAKRSIRKNAFGDDKYLSAIMHRRILRINNPKILIDHKDHDGLNNQKFNLRKSNPSQNCANRISNPKSSSKYLGVSWDTNRSKWFACICKNYKTISLGRFDDEKEAAMAYNKAAKIIHGEFANLNQL